LRCRTLVTADAAVSVRGLTKRFGGQLAVDDLTFDVPAGDRRRRGALAGRPRVGRGADRCGG
ncbi:MAG: hypothetical protein WEB09_09290, partial [Nitriliruptor sp.]